MDVLLLINDAPYATERPYNALRIATALSENGNHSVRLFFLGDGVRNAVPTPPPDSATYDIEWMVRRLAAGAPPMAVCRTCLEQRGLTGADLLAGAQESTLEVLTRWLSEADRVLVF